MDNAALLMQALRLIRVLVWYVMVVPVSTEPAFQMTHVPM
jgi:hypothetical protein